MTTLARQQHKNLPDAPDITEKVKSKQRANLSHLHTLTSLQCDFTGKWTVP